jgi:hypothetical protein
MTSYEHDPDLANLFAASDLEPASEPFVSQVSARVGRIRRTRRGFQASSVAAVVLAAIALHPFLDAPIEFLSWMPAMLIESSGAFLITPAGVIASAVAGVSAVVRAVLMDG